MKVFRFFVTADHFTFYYKKLAFNLYLNVSVSVRLS